MPFRYPLDDIIYMKRKMYTARALALLSFAVVAGSCVGAGPDVAPAGSPTIVSASPTVASPRPISYETLRASLEAPGSSILVLDVRTKEEYDSGHIPGASLFPYDALSASFKEPDKARPIVVYCRSGRRSAIAAETLVGMGYTDVSDLGGLDAWKGGLAR